MLRQITEALVRIPALAACRTGLTAQAAIDSQCLAGLRGWTLREPAQSIGSLVIRRFINTFCRLIGVCAANTRELALLRQATFEALRSRERPNVQRLQVVGCGRF